jgi:hypothetical protein
MGFSRSFGFDVRLTHSRLQGSECQIHFTSPFINLSFSEVQHETTLPRPIVS